MLFTLMINFVNKGFLKNMSRVHFVKKMKDLLLISLKILKHFLNSVLLVSKVISEHIMKMSSLMTSMFNL